MKKSNIIYVAVAVAVIALILYFSLRHSEADGHNHSEGEKPETEEAHAKGEEANAGNKEVELNEAQFKSSAIKLGSFVPKNLSEVINANGYTELPPQNQADVSVFTSGIVKSIAVVEGGKEVRKGQVLAVIESPEFAKLHEEYQTSKSNLEFLTLEFERQKTLSEQEVNSKKTFQKTRADYQVEKARFASLQRQLALLNINGNGTPSASVPVLAPISGSITEINIKIGSNVEAGKPLLGIVDNSKLHVDLLVYEKDLNKVKAGQNVRFVLTNQDNTEIMGKIFSVGKSFETETKSVAVHATITNDRQQLIPGQYVNALIDIGSNTVNALPVEAIVKAEGREFIFVLEEGHNEEASKETAHDEKEGHDHEDGDKHAEKEGKTYHFQRIEVKTGTAQLGFVQVNLLQKIDSDAKIVLKGAYYIQSHLLKSEGGGGHDH